MTNAITNYFEFRKHGTSLRREVIAGVTTFLTMSYIIVVNPKILEAAGMPLGASMVATVLTAAFGTLLMGFYAKRPFAIAPYMGENAFIAYTVVVLLGYSWQQAMAAILIAGVLFILLTVLRLRQWLISSIPECLRYSFAAGIGLFMAFIGLNVTGIVVLGVEAAPVKIGDVTSAPVLLAIFNFFLISIMMMRKIRAAVLIGIATTTILSYISGVVALPANLVSYPPSLAPTLLQMDFTGVFTWGFFVIVLTVFVMAFVDTMGTLIGVSSLAGFLDKDGNLPEIERPMIADALSTTFAGLVGTTTAGAYLESASGIETGGRTGFTAVIVAILFLFSLFLAPLLTAVPAQAYGPPLIVIGMLMVKAITKINYQDMSELFPAFSVIILMSFTFNIGVGITSGFVTYPIFKFVAGKRKELNPGVLFLSFLSLMFFLFYPY